MRANLPLHLVRSILLLSLTLNASPTSTSEASTSESPASSATTSSSSSVEPTATPRTLWDIGFSINDGWSDLREVDECPVPPDLVVVADNAGEGDQVELEQVVSSLHPPVSLASPFSATSAELHSSLTAAPADTTPTGPIEPGKEQAEKEDFVSFEEWRKIKQAEEDAGEESDDDEDDVPHPAITKEAPVVSEDRSKNGSDQKHHDRSSMDNVLSEIQNQTSQSSPSAAQTLSNTSIPPSAPSPPPQHNRYNYASPDCSARIHSASPQTQNPSSLLHKSRDRYMLTPCKANEHWVVVELCDEIRIESLEIAVWEFFSGVVREVVVSVGGEDDGAWEEVGKFVGKNVRGHQTYTLDSPTSFHRFLRLDFPSHYGSEYYCPVSQLKAFGMNQMEAFKWEQKRINSHKAKDSEDRKRDERERKDRDEAEKRERAKGESERAEGERLLERQVEAKRERELGELEKLISQQASKGLEGDVEIPLTAVPILLDTASISPSQRSETVRDATSTTAESSTAITTSATSAHTSSISSSASTSTSTSTSTYSRSPPPKSDSSESIYAFIIRRLNALEGNSTLVARYIEEQSKSMRSMLKAVERGWDDWRVNYENEERSRGEMERMRHEDRLGRVSAQLEHQRLALENDRRRIESQLRVVADELSFERRRGLAQLFLILLMIVLGVVTRFSTIDTMIAEARRRRRSIRGKGKSGPLTGLKIDLGKDRPMAVIGEKRPPSLSAIDTSTPTARARTISNSRSPIALKRPSTPTVNSTLRQRRQPSLGQPTNFRSFSTADPVQGPPQAQRHVRKMGKSAHLHTLEAGRPPPPHHVRANSVPHGMAEELHGLSPLSPKTPRFGDAPTLGMSVELEGEGDWQETDNETEVSVSDIDETLDTETGRDVQLEKAIRAIWGDQVHDNKAE
ncbi:hypothetical protein P7C73_g4470, partial [Tremellales sp. Uapishka_1]